MVAGFVVISFCVVSSQGSVKQKAKGQKPLAVNAVSPNAITGELKRTFHQALKGAQSIKEERLRSWALRDIVKVVAKVSLLDQAYEVAKSIEQPIPRLCVNCFERDRVIDALGQ